MSRLRPPPACYSELAILAMFLIWWFHVQVFGDGDTAWHTAAGRLILENGALPVTDPWSYATQGNPWFNASWLFDVGLAALERVGGWNAPFLVMVVSYVALWPMLAWVCVRRGADWPPTVMACWLGACVAIHSVAVRPHMLSLWLCLGFYALLAADRARPGHRVFILLPGLMILWANIHGAFLVGLALIGAFAVESLLARQYARFGRLTALGVLVLATTLVNPYGIGVYEAVRLTLDSALKPQLIEWLPLDPRRQSLFLGFALAVFAPGLLRAGGAPVAERLIALGITVMGFYSIRYFFFAAVLAAPYLALSYTHLLRESPLADRYRRYAERFARDKSTSRQRLLNSLAALMFAALIVHPATRARLWPDGWIGMPNLAPETEFLKTHYPGERMVSDLMIAAFFILAKAEVPAILYDGRQETAFPSSVIRDVADFYAKKLHPDALLARYRARGFVLLNGSGIVRYLVDILGYRVVFEGATASVLVPATDSTPTRRQKSPNPSPAARAPFQ